MQSLSLASVEYRVFAGMRPMRIISTRAHPTAPGHPGAPPPPVDIYDGCESLPYMASIRNVSEAHAVANTWCHLSIGLFGAFTSLMTGNMFPDGHMDKSLISLLPYWMILKLNSEYALLDNQLERTLKIQQQKQQASRMWNFYLFLQAIKHREFDYCWEDLNLFFSCFWFNKFIARKIFSFSHKLKLS